jgi:RNA exonuclease 1
MISRWSGITPEALATATHTLATVQAHLLDPANNLITPNTILLGHSLECDLSALKIKHPHCIDTSVIFQHPKGPPYKQGLKFLAGRFLNREIQNAQGSKVGHDSEEDAKACVDLLKAKLAYGPEFGVVPQETESIFERLARNKNTTLVCDHGNPLTWYGAKATTVVQCESDQQVVDGLKAHVGSHELSFGRLMALQKSLGCTSD